MNVEIGAETALFPEKEFISGIFVAVQLIHYAARKPVLPVQLSAPRQGALRQPCSCAPSPQTAAPRTPSRPGRAVKQITKNGTHW
jgi:hypothetical protein